MKVVRVLVNFYITYDLWGEMKLQVKASLLFIPYFMRASPSDVVDVTRITTML